MEEVRPGSLLPTPRFWSNRLLLRWRTTFDGVRPVIGVILKSCVALNVKMLMFVIAAPKRGHLAVTVLSGRRKTLKSPKTTTYVLLTLLVLFTTRILARVMRAERLPRF